MKRHFVNKAFEAACKELDKVVGDKNGKAPCRNYFINQGFCHWPDTCKKHHIGTAGLCAPDESERQTNQPPAKKPRK